MRLIVFATGTVKNRLERDGQSLVFEAQTVAPTRDVYRGVLWGPLSLRIISLKYVIHLLYGYTFCLPS